MKATLEYASDLLKSEAIAGALAEANRNIARSLQQFMVGFLST